MKSKDKLRKNIGKRIYKLGNRVWKKGIEADFFLKNDTKEKADKERSYKKDERILRIPTSILQHAFFHAMQKAGLIENKLL